MKTSELSDIALDWAVAMATGNLESRACFVMGNEVWDTLNSDPDFPVRYSPSTDWAQAGPIIERIKGFELKQWLESRNSNCCEAHIHNYEGDWVSFGPTPLIAAMRCYVFNKLGEEVDIPADLIGK